ncbi:hypothetical protein [Ostreiculturibacter nitratireducens]|uniref:hypothetical protein n=1 Tax=Ostreiculturibacter nitratireducens TaxID=3075226 RepID=UPI0031B64A92
MEQQTLSMVLALNGALVLVFSMTAGLVLYRRILSRSRPEDWHLLHAGGSTRGVMLIALAATVHLAALSDRALLWASMLVLYFAWASVLAMFLRALTGEQGYQFSGTFVNRVTFLLYASGVVTVFAGFGWWILGLLRGLQLAAG